MRLLELIPLREDPECYLLGKQRLGLSADADCLVIEDSPAGCKAGKAAGCKVVGLTTTHSIAQLKAMRPDWIVKDLRSIRYVNDGSVETSGNVGIEISDTLVL